MADTLKLFALFGHSGRENWGTAHGICVFWHVHAEVRQQCQVPRVVFPKLAERLALCAPRWRKWPTMSICLLFWAFQLRKLRECSNYKRFLPRPWKNRLIVSGSVRYIPETCGTSHTFCAGVTKMSDSVKLFAEIGGVFKLFALMSGCAHSIPETCVTSHVFCAVMMKMTDNARCCAFCEFRSRQLVNFSSHLRFLTSPWWHK